MMKFDDSYLRHVLLFLYRQGKTVAGAHRQICSLYGSNATGESTCHKWFSTFKEPDFHLDDMKDKPKPGPVKKMPDDELEALLNEDPGQTEWDLAMQLGVNQSTISRRLKELGYVSKEGKYVTHVLTQHNMLQRATIAASLYSRQRKKSFLHKIVTEDKTPIFFENPEPQHYWFKPGQPAPHTLKPGKQRKKASLCV
uniref:Mos1 transposase HTH domain-containing protein n=1 Tax=Acrobeloides nanus TaxID=290746 RepID=A0A914D0J7_9BILA